MLPHPSSILKPPEVGISSASQGWSEDICFTYYLVIIKRTGRFFFQAILECSNCIGATSQNGFRRALLKQLHQSNQATMSHCHLYRLPKKDLVKVPSWDHSGPQWCTGGRMVQSLCMFKKKVSILPAIYEMNLSSFREICLGLWWNEYRYLKCL